MVMIDLGNDIEIRKDGKIVARVGLSDVAEQKRELMKENYVLLSFNLDYYFPFDRGHTITYKGEEYVIREEARPEEVNVQEYRYSLKFEGVDMLFQDLLLFYPYSNQPEGEWMLTAAPEYFLQAAVENIRNQLEDSSWEIGKKECTTPIEMSFENISVFDACTEVAKAAEGEWYVDFKAKTLNLVKKYEHGVVVEFEREVNLTDIKRTNENNSEFCTRMYAYGSTKNIPANYRPPNNGEPIDRIASKRLRLPGSKGYVGIEDIMPDIYKDLKPYEIKRKVFIFDEVFPKSQERIEGLRDEVKSIEKKPYTAYFFTNEKFDFDENYILPGQSLMMSFQGESRLAGRDFELKYHIDDKEYEIIPNQDNPDFIIPNEKLAPEKDDEYILYNFDTAVIGDKYVGIAEDELKTVAENKLRQIIENNATYTCSMAMAACSQKDLELEIGQKVRLKSAMFKDQQKDSRIYGYTKRQNECTYLVGDSSEYSNLGDISAQVTANKKEANSNYNDNKKDSNNNKKKINNNQEKIDEVSHTVKELDYIKEALSMNTSIEGGLILSAILQLGTKVDDNFTANAGLNGILQKPTDPAFWIGGSIQDAKARKTSLGFLADGSGWMAQDMISWETIQGVIALLVTGKYRSAKSGERIEIDPQARSIKMYDDKEKVIVNISFENNNNAHTALIRVNNYQNDNLTGSAIIEGGRFSLRNQMDKEYFSVSFANNRLNMKLDGVPESRANAEVKGLYIDENETLKIRKD